MSSIHVKQEADTQIIYTYTLLKSEKDKRRFEYSIHILEFIQCIHRVNKIYKKWGCKTRINTNVFYTALELILTQKTFNTKTLKAYLKALKKVEAFKQVFGRLFQVEHFTFNYNAESLLLGLPLALVVNPPECVDDLGEVRFNVLYTFYSGKIGVKKTIHGLRIYRDKVLKYL